MSKTLTKLYIGLIRLKDLKAYVDLLVKFLEDCSKLLIEFWEGEEDGKNSI